MLFLENSLTPRTPSMMPGKQDSIASEGMKKDLDVLEKWSSFSSLLSTL